jgi:hypothetical protein
MLVVDLLACVAVGMHMDFNVDMCFMFVSPGVAYELITLEFA